MASQTQINPAVLLLDGQRALRQGQKEQAQALFRAVLEIDPSHEEALLWLSGTVEPNEALLCLKKVLAINPANEQAQEGILWLHEQGMIEQQPVAVPEIHAAPPRDQRPVPTVHPLSELLEWAGHVAIIGALLGLLSLAFALRAQALFIGRGEGGPIGWGGALGLAVVGAVTHSLGLLVSWWLLGTRLAQLRNDHRGDRFLSLREASQAMLPGYLAAPALGITLLGVGFSEQRWIPVVVVVLIMLGTALVWTGQRILRLRAPLRMSHQHERRQLVALLGPALLGGGAALVLASLLIRLLLHTAA